jgi:hypothetical protein
MTIHYSIWQGSSLLGVFTAKESQEVLDRLESLKPLGTFTHNIFKIEG